MSLLFSSKEKPKLILIDESYRLQAIELLNLFFKQINSYPLDGIFKVKPKAGTKMVDSFLKLVGGGKVVFAGIVVNKELVSMLIARIEERPFLQEEKILYIDIAVTKNGHHKKGYMNSLLEYAEKWALKKEIKVLELRTLSENTSAIQFWKNRNYTDFYVRFRKNI